MKVASEITDGRITLSSLVLEIQIIDRLVINWIDGSEAKKNNTEPVVVVVEA